MRDARWVSSLAVMRVTDDNPDPIVFAVSRLPNTRASLTSWIVTDSGVTMRDGHLYDGSPHSAPVLMRNVRSNKGHVVLFPGPAGSLQAFDAWSLAEVRRKRVRAGTGS